MKYIKRTPNLKNKALPIIEVYQVEYEAKEHGAYIIISTTMKHKFKVLKCFNYLTTDFLVSIIRLTEIHLR